MSPILVFGLAARFPALQGQLVWDDTWLVPDHSFINSPWLNLEAFRHFLSLDFIWKRVDSGKPVPACGTPARLDVHDAESLNLIALMDVRQTDCQIPTQSKVALFLGSPTSPANSYWWKTFSKRWDATLRLGLLSLR